MRITVTLDPDVEALVKETMQEQELSFEQALKRQGSPEKKLTPFPTKQDYIPDRATLYP